jgi:hypothetical protein
VIGLRDVLRPFDTVGTLEHGNDVKRPALPDRLMQPRERAHVKHCCF